MVAEQPNNLPLWRELFTAGPFVARFSQAPPKELPQAAYAIALRAAREQGKKGEKLVAVLTPLAGATAQPPPPADYSQLVQETLASGDPAAGEEVYRRTGMACTVCHAIGGAGGKVGPELGTIGASAPLDYIIESLLNPNAKVKEGYNAVSVTQKDGAVAMGIPVRETANDIVIRNAAGQEQTIAKELISSKENLGSIMPPGLTEQLKPREKINLYAFLSQLGKKGVYDASRGYVARSWWLNAKNEGTVAAGTPVVYSNVDGRLPKERLTDSLAIFPNATEVYAATKISAAEAIKTQLLLTGVREAWLDGKPLAVASEPSPAVELSAGNHTLVVKLDPKSLPEVLRAEAANVRFLTE
jgi:putative heme-binding domain-containing protein